MRVLARSAQVGLGGLLVCELLDCGFTFCDIIHSLVVKTISKGASIYQRFATCTITFCLNPNSGKWETCPESL